MMKTTAVVLALSFAFAAVPAMPAERSEPVVGRSSFARCYKYVVRKAAEIERIRARRAAQVCDGKSLAEAASLANLRINAVIRHINQRVARFAGTGPAACDPNLFDGDPLPSFPVPEETPAESAERLAARVSECDGPGGLPP